MAYTQGRIERNQLKNTCLFMRNILEYTIAVHTFNNVPIYKKCFILLTHRAYWPIKNSSKLFPFRCCWLPTI